MNFHAYQRGKKGEIEIPSVKSIPYSMYLPEDLGLSNPFRLLRQLARLTFLNPRDGALLWLLLAFFDYWLISFLP